MLWSWPSLLLAWVERWCRRILCVLWCLTEWRVAWHFCQPLARCSIVESTKTSKHRAHAVIYDIFQRVSFFIVWGHVTVILPEVLWDFLSVDELVVLLLEDELLLFLADIICLAKLLEKRRIVSSSSSTSCWRTSDIPSQSFINDSWWFNWIFNSAWPKRFVIFLNLWIDTVVLISRRSWTLWILVYRISLLLIRFKLKTSCDGLLLCWCLILVRIFRLLWCKTFQLVEVFYQVVPLSFW